MRSYVINLDREAERFQHFMEQWRFTDLPVERISATDGRQMPPAELDAFRQESFRERGWMPGQIGCLFSHREAWRRIAESGAAFGAVFEDDIHFGQDLASFLSDTAWIPAGADIVRLETSRQLMRLGSPLPGLKGRSVRKLTGPAWGTGAYILSADTARLLLAAPNRWLKPTDYMLFDHDESPLARSLSAFQLTPALCIQDKFRLGAGVQFASEIEAAGSAGGSWKDALRPLLGRLTGRDLVPCIP